VPATARQNAFIERFVADLCALVIIAKVVKGESISLTGVLKPVVEGKASIPQVGRLAFKALGTADYADVVREFLLDPFIDPAASPAATTTVVTDDDDDAPVDVVLLKFKTALHALYEAQSGVPSQSSDSDSEDEDLEDYQLNDRLKVTAVFDPMRAAIPSMEEAQNIARRLAMARNAGKNRPTLSARPAPPTTAGGGRGGGAAAGDGGGGVKVIKAVSTGTAAGAAPAAARTPGPRKDGEKAERLNMSKAGHIDVEPTDFVDVADVSFPEFGERVQQVCRQLATVEKLDQIVWSLFIDPAASLADVKALARTLAKENTDTFKAYSAIRMAVQFLQLNNLLSSSEKALQKERNFLLEVTQFLNTVNKSNRELQPEARPLAPLAKVLDHAAGALVRLEAVRVNTMMGEDHGDEYSKEAATVYCQGALRQVADLTDREILNQARAAADIDTAALFGSFSAVKHVDGVQTRSHEYVKGIVDAGRADSVESLQAHFAEQPLAFDGAEAKSESSEIPAEIIKPSELGDIFDTVATYVCSQAWAAMEAAHSPERVLEEIVEDLRQLLVSCFKFQPERKRHQDNPRLALSVVGLDRIAGNANLKELFVRVREDGQVHYVEDFEDGTWVDLFQLREYKPARLATAAKKKADDQDTEMLQTGRKYSVLCGPSSEALRRVRGSGDQ
jgi:hypothetical protein